MLKIILPYKVGNPEQIPIAYILKKNFGIEANVFDARELLKTKHFQKIKAEFNKINAGNTNLIRSFHFPTENADYLNDVKILTALKNAIILCDKCHIDILVLHSNAITDICNFDSRHLNHLRKKYLDLYTKLDNWIETNNLRVTICIENMPIIGNTGDDFDSVFVFTKDFKSFDKFKHIKITWDLCHWGFTIRMFKKLKKTYPKIKKVEAKDMWNLENKIAHWHFGSFKKMITVGSGINCEEGSTPESGLISKKFLATTIQKLQKDTTLNFITLEIKETRYTNRINFRRTVTWINHISRSKKMASLSHPKTA